MNKSKKRIDPIEVFVKNKVFTNNNNTNNEQPDNNQILSHETSTSDTSTKRTVIYLRFSTENVRQSGEYEERKKFLQEVVERHPNWFLEDIYIDMGFASKPRAAFSQMLADCKAGKIDVIVTKSMSQFTRSLPDFLFYMQELQALNPPVGVLFEKEGIFTLDSPISF